MTFEREGGFVETRTRTGTSGELTVLCRDNWSAECKKKGGKKKERKRGREGEIWLPKGDLSPYRPVDRPQAGSQVHLRVDETWRSCLQFWRKGLLDSHVALEFLSHRFISRFLRPPPTTRLLSPFSLPSSLPSFSFGSSPSLPLPLLPESLVFLTAAVSASKCAPRMRNSEDVTW